MDSAPDRDQLLDCFHRIAIIARFDAYSAEKHRNAADILDGMEYLIQLAKKNDFDSFRDYLSDMARREPRLKYAIALLNQSSD